MIFFVKQDARILLWLRRGGGGGAPCRIFDTHSDLLTGLYCSVSKGSTKIDHIVKLILQPDLTFWKRNFTHTIPQLMFPFPEGPTPGVLVVSAVAFLCFKLIFG